MCKYIAELDIQTKTLRNIIYARARSSLHQELILKAFTSMIEKDPEVRLLLVDSIIGNYRLEFPGSNLLPHRQRRLYGFIQGLLYIAQNYGIAVVVTNQTNYGSSLMPRPTGGNIIAKSSNYRISLGRLDRCENTIEAMITKSQYHPEGKTIFTLSEKGIDDLVRT
jgi:RecA/RadA recombinase